MRRIAILFLALTLSIVCIGQKSMRNIKGITVNEGGVTVPNVTLKVDGVSTEFHSGRTGQFEFSVPISCKTLTAFANGYAATKVDVSGQFVIVRMIPEGKAPAANEVVAPAVVHQTVASSVTSSATDESAYYAPLDTETYSSRSKLYKKGFYNAIDISYSYSFNGGRAIYTNLGERSYAALHPVQLSYSLGYKFSPQYTLYAGAGFMYNIMGLEKYDTVEKDIYRDFTSRTWDVPVFLGLTITFGGGLVRPLLLLQGGVYVMALVPDFELGFGMTVECGSRGAFNLIFTARNVEWPHLSVSQFNGYPITIAPSVKLGFSF